MGNRPTQLTSFTVTLLVILLGLSFITGIGLWYVHEQREKFANKEIQSLPKWTSVCQVSHGLLNPAITAMFGYIWFAHVRGGWRMGVNRRSGGTLSGIMIVLIATGAGLYYGGGRHFWFTLHLLAGLLLVFVLPVHWLAAGKWVRTMDRN